LAVCGLGVVHDLWFLSELPLASTGCAQHRGSCHVLGNTCNT
jgi:hypothetical protein